MSFGTLFVPFFVYSQRMWASSGNVFSLKWDIISREFTVKKTTTGEFFLQKKPQPKSISSDSEGEAWCRRLTTLSRHRIKLVLRFFQQFTAHGHKSGSVRLKEKQTGQKLKIYFSFVVVISCFWAILQRCFFWRWDISCIYAQRMILNARTPCFCS